MKTPHIVATLHMNYNGWTLEDLEDQSIKRYDELEIICDEVLNLPDITVVDSDEDGWTDPEKETIRKVKRALKAHFGKETAINIEFDKHST